MKKHFWFYVITYKYRFCGDVDEISKPACLNEMCSRLKTPHKNHHNKCAVQFETHGTKQMKHCYKKQYKSFLHIKFNKRKSKASIKHERKKIWLSASASLLKNFHKIDFVWAVFHGQKWSFFYVGHYYKKELNKIKTLSFLV